MPLKQKRDRLTNSEIKRLAELWALGVTARAASVLVDWNRNTVTRYFQRFRMTEDEKKWVEEKRRAIRPFTLVELGLNDRDGARDFPLGVFAGLGFLEH